MTLEHFFRGQAGNPNALFALPEASSRVKSRPNVQQGYLKDNEKNK